MVLLFLIEAVLFLFSLPFVMVSEFLPSAPNLGSNLDTLVNQIKNLYNVLVYMLTMGGNSFFVGLYDFCVAVIDFIALYWLITKTIDLVKSIFIKE